MLEKYPQSKSAPEALYWKGVSHYKATNDHTVLGELPGQFRENYPDSDWALKTIASEQTVSSRAGVRSTGSPEVRAYRFDDGERGMQRLYIRTAESELSATSGGRVNAWRIARALSNALVTIRQRAVDELDPFPLTTRHRSSRNRSCAICNVRCDTSTPTIS